MFRDSLGNLSNLTVLELDLNQLTGQIPPELGNLSLERVKLSNNLLSGCVPEGLGARRFSSFGTLPYCGAPEWQTVPCALRGAVLDADENPDLVSDCETLLKARESLGWTPVTLSWSANTYFKYWDGVSVSERVTSLDLAGQTLNGQIPPELADLDALQSLDLSRGRLSGPIPTELGSLRNLQYLRLGGNDLSGVIPAELGGLGKLEDLRLEDNDLDGQIPVELGRLSNLKWLDLSGNQLSGPIPAALGRLSKLEGLDLKGNLLTGPIPVEFGRLRELRWIDLDLDGVTGCIPLRLWTLMHDRVDPKKHSICTAAGP